MRLGLNKNGIIVPKRGEIKVMGQTQILRTPSNALTRINKVKENRSLNALVLRGCGGIGDVLMTLPTVREIRKQYNIERLDYATDFDYLDGALKKVLLYNKDIDNILEHQMVTEEQKDSYDIVVNLSCPCLVHEVPHAPSVNRIDLFARHAGIGLTDTSISYTITSEELTWAQQYLAQNNIQKFILVQSNSSTKNRDLPLLTLQRTVMGILKEMPGYKAVVITHGELDNDWNLCNVVRFHNYDIRNIAAIMNYSELVLCPDSAILHLAGALHKKIVSFFGPTDPYARVNYYENAIAICAAKELQCFWCWYTRSCHGTMICWKLLKEDMIIEPSLSILKNEFLEEKDYLINFDRYSKNIKKTYDEL